MQGNVASMTRPEMPPVPAGCPAFTLWAVTVQDHITRERQKRWIRFTGPMPLKAELDYFCPPKHFAIAEMKFLWPIWKADD